MGVVGVRYSDLTGKVVVIKVLLLGGPDNLAREAGVVRRRRTHG
ncbi:hypothetical protein [Streptomyces sp. FH025]|nr:hypothetical protein [Streptomyces sp. FH025]